MFFVSYFTFFHFLKPLRKPCTQKCGIKQCALKMDIRQYMCVWSQEVAGSPWDEGGLWRLHLDGLGRAPDQRVGDRPRLLASLGQLRRRRRREAGEEERGRGGAVGD